MAMIPSKSVENYRIAWITALKIETASALQMLDEEHDEPSDFQRHPEDQNCYDWGRIHGHDIVLTSLPAASYGKVNAATCVAELISSLPSIKFGLLVGIGAGLPTAQNDIRLGDVVVGQPEHSHGGVIQYDLGKAVADGTWEPKGYLASPPRILLNALAKLQARHESGRIRLIEFLEQAMNRNSQWGEKYAYPLHKEDRLFGTERISNTDGSELQTTEVEVMRTKRSNRNPYIHYGAIASGDSLVKDGTARDAILKKIKQSCLCIEMEAAGLMNKFPCLVIRGISDYADRHKNDDWQRYASATAAALGKELLLYVPINEIKHSQNATDRMESQAASHLLREQFSKTNDMLEKEKVDSLLRDLYTCPYAERKDINIEALEGTCQWFIGHEGFINFVTNPAAKLLWVTADPGCGKSVLSKYLVDRVLNINEDRIICYFFFKDDLVDQNRSAQAMIAMLRQLICAVPGSLTQETLNEHASSGKLFGESFQDLWKAFLLTAANSAAKSIICVFDALDECQSTDRRMLIRAISDWHQNDAISNLKILATSRPYSDITDDFHGLTTSHPHIHLSGDNDIEAEEISKEIDIVIEHRIRTLCERRRLQKEVQTALTEKFIRTPHRTYLWAHLTMDLVESMQGLTTGRVQDVLKDLPATVNQAYEKILNRSQEPERTRLLLHILMAAQRPLSVEEVSIAFSLTGEQKDTSDLSRDVEPASTFKDTVRELCSLFIIIKESHIFFLHQTAREFLSSEHDDLDKSGNAAYREMHGQFWYKSFPPAESHHVLAEQCLRLLFVKGSHSYHESFFDYCNHYWPLHFCRGEIMTASPLNDLAVKIIRNWSSNYWRLPERIRKDHGLRVHESIERCIPPIFFPSWFGLPSVLQTLLNWYPLIKDREDIMYTALSLACHPGTIGRIATVKILLAHGATLRGNRHRFLAAYGYKGSEWKDPLPLTLVTSNWNLARLLLQNESAASVVNEETSNEFKPLELAVPGSVEEVPHGPFSINHNNSTHRRYDIETIKTLIKLGAEVEARDFDGAMAIHHFLKGSRVLSAADINEISYDPELASLTSLHTALKLLLPSGVNVNEHDVMSGASLMGFAVFTGLVELIQAMLMLGGSLDIRDRAGNSLLCYVPGSDDDVIDLILSHGVDIESRNDDGLTALLLASGCGFCEPLLKRGADHNIRDRRGRTTLMYALGVPHVVSPLKHTWLDRFGEFYWTGLNEDMDRIRCLINAGTDVNAKDIDGYACIHHLVLNSYARRLSMHCLPLLLGAGLDINSTTRAGQTALHLIARTQINRSYTQDDLSFMQDHPSFHYDHSEQLGNLMQALLKQSADPTIVDHNGRTALWYLEKSIRRSKINDRTVMGNWYICQSTIDSLLRLRHGVDVELISLYEDHEVTLYLKNVVWN